MNNAEILMNSLNRWRYKSMVSICRGYLESTYKSLCLVKGETYELDLTLPKLAAEVTRLYNELQLHKNP